jgi:hypothetical protein
MTGAASRRVPEARTPFTCALPPELIGRLRVECARHNEQIGRFVERALVAALAALSPIQQETLMPWRLAEPIRTALARTRFVALTQDERWWRAEFVVRNGLDFPRELLRAEAWCASNPDRAPRRNYRRFLNTWFERAQGESE